MANKKLTIMLLALNTLPFGLSVSASARIGNLIGARKAMHARLSAHTAAFLSVCIGGIVMVILLILRDVSQQSVCNTSRTDVAASVLVACLVMTQM
jgi:Na+-driven multidrug efflux pump